jgi:hypothetical protein
MGGFGATPRYFSEASHPYDGRVQGIVPFNFHLLNGDLPSRLVVEHSGAKRLTRQAVVQCAQGGMEV